MTTEFPAQAEVILCAFQMGFALWRNNSGVSREEHRHVRYGLGNDSWKINKKWKSADLIGVGPRGRILWVEMKKPDWKFNAKNERDVAQGNAIKQVNRLGGIAFFCRSVEEFKINVERCL